MTRHEFAIPSMHCEHSAANIQRYLRDQPGDEAAEVDDGAGCGRLEVAADGDVEELLGVLDAMGYEARLID